MTREFTEMPENSALDMRNNMSDDTSTNVHL